MTLRGRVLGAGAAVLAIAAGMWLYLLWPRWYGTEVVLPVNLRAQGGSAGGVFTTYPDSRLQLDATNTLAADGQAAAAHVDVRSVGVVWDSRHEPRAEAARMRNRTVYLQLKTIDKTASTGEVLSHPVGISTTPVPDVINLRVRVVHANSAAQIDVDIAGGRLPLAPGLPLDHAAAILKVLPSGRHAIVGVIAGGKRIMF